MRDVLSIIMVIIRDKKLRRIVPIHALRREILSGYSGSLTELDNSLADLKAKGLIVECRTVNDVAFLVVDYNPIIFDGDDK